MKRLTPHEDRVLVLLRLRGLNLIAEVTERQWRRGESYYIDARVQARGLRRAFELGNRQAVAGKPTGKRRSQIH